MSQQPTSESSTSNKSGKSNKTGKSGNGFSENSSIRGITLVAMREIRIRGFSKANIISLIISAVVVGALAWLPTLIGGDDDDYTVGLVGEGSAAYETILGNEDLVGVTINTEEFTDLDTAKTTLEDGDLDAVLDGDTLYTDGTLNAQLSLAIDSTYQSVVSAEQLSALDVDPAAVQQALTVTPLNQVDVSDSSNDSMAGYFVGLIVTIFIFMMMMMPIQFVAMGVVEEKSSRIVEILLTTLRPWQLLAGKIIGLGLVALTTMVVVVAVGLVSAALSGLLPSLPPGMSGIFVSTIGWWLLGFLVFGSLAGGIGSMVSRQEEAGSALMPVTMLLMIGYGGSFFILNAPTAPFAQALSIIPPFSSIAMPARMAVTSVPTWEVAVAVGALIIAAVVAIMLAASIYKRSVLQTGSRLKFKDIFGKNK